jgi:hypothetical protein
MVDILDDGGYMKVVEDVVNREIVVIEVLSPDLLFVCCYSDKSNYSVTN